MFRGDCNNVGVISLIEMIYQDTNNNVAYVFYKGSVRTNYQKVIDVNRQLNLKTEINKKNIQHNIQIVQNQIDQITQ